MNLVLSCVKKQPKWSLVEWGQKRNEGNSMVVRERMLGRKMKLLEDGSRIDQMKQRRCIK